MIRSLTGLMKITLVFIIITLTLHTHTHIHIYNVCDVNRIIGLEERDSWSSFDIECSSTCIARARVWNFCVKI